MFIILHIHPYSSKLCLGTQVINIEGMGEAKTIYHLLFLPSNSFGASKDVVWAVAFFFSKDNILSELTF